MMPGAPVPMGDDLQALRSSIVRWVIGTGLALAFAGGAWAANVQKDIANLEYRVGVIEQPFISLRTELAATRETVAALRDAVQELRTDIRRDGK